METARSISKFCLKYNAVNFPLEKSRHNVFVWNVLLDDSTYSDWQYSDEDGTYSAIKP